MLRGVCLTLPGARVVGTVKADSTQRRRGAEKRSPERVLTRRKTRSERGARRKRASARRSRRALRAGSWVLWAGDKLHDHPRQASDDRGTLPLGHLLANLRRDLPNWREIALKMAGQYLDGNHHVGCHVRGERAQIHIWTCLNDINAGNGKNNGLNKTPWLLWPPKANQPVRAA